MTLDRHLVFRHFSFKNMKFTWSAIDLWNRFIVWRWQQANGPARRTDWIISCTIWDSATSSHQIGKCYRSYPIPSPHWSYLQRSQLSSGPIKLLQRLVEAQMMWWNLTNFRKPARKCNGHYFRLTIVRHGVASQFESDDYELLMILNKD